MARVVGRGGGIMSEIIRLAIVVLMTVIGYAIGPVTDDAFGVGEPVETRLITSVLGALLGYLLGGAAGRFFVRGVDVAQERLKRVESSQLIAATVGATLAAIVALIAVLPVLFLPSKEITVPVAVAFVAALTYAGGRIGAARGGDLSRYVGVRGRLEVTSPSRGGGTKLVDTSALIDGRIVDVARAGFLEGTLVVPRFVLAEMQSLADLENHRKRTMARRGLDALHTLQTEHLVVVEITDDDAPGVADVDAKLAQLARTRSASLITVDGNLARVAEISGVRVLNLHDLAEALKPPVIPGDRVRVQVVKPGREHGQGIGYLEDGTMVVIEGGAAHLGAWLDTDVTSIVSSRQGRMLFGAPALVEAEMEAEG